VFSEIITIYNSERNERRDVSPIKICNEAHIFYIKYKYINFSLTDVINDSRDTAIIQGAAQ